MKSLFDVPDEVNEKGRNDDARPFQSQMTSEDDAELLELVKTLKVKISIIGCGGGGSNTARRVTQAGVTGATIVACNSDARHLLGLQVPNKVLLGKSTTKGLGAGAIPEIGQQAAEESEGDLRKYVTGANIVFVTTGMGGGTGTGSAPVVAEMARKQGALVIGIVTLPFKAEGRVRMENAIRGLENLKEHCDTTIVVQNDKLLELVPRLPIEAAFKVADEVLMQSIKGITEVVTKPALVNLDFNDILTIMKNGGIAMIGIGETDSDDDRVNKVVEEALSSPMLGAVDLHEAKGAMIRVIGGPDMTVSEAEKAAELVSQAVNPRARIIWGCAIEPDMKGKMTAMVIITGIKQTSIIGKTEDEKPQPPAKAR